MTNQKPVLGALPGRILKGEFMVSHQGFSGTRWARRGLTAAGLALTLIVLLPQRGFGQPSPNKGGPPPSDLSVTTEIFNVDSGGFVSTISSDNGTAYQNNVNGVSSVLTANTCNGLTYGDWRFSSVGATRSVIESFFSGDAILPGEPGAQTPFVAAKPPYTGSALQHPMLNVQCTCTAHQNMYTMTAGQTFTCPLLNHWTDSITGSAWSEAPDHSFSGNPENTDAQVTCNSVGGGHCVDWFIDPIPSLPLANQAVGRVVETPNCRKCGKVNDGDFRMRFRIHVSLP